MRLVLFRRHFDLCSQHGCSMQSVCQQYITCFDAWGGFTLSVEKTVTFG